MTPTHISSVSSKQLEANRANSQHSTGPVTDAGKEKVSMNAVRHGMYSTATLLPGEDREAYEALGRMLWNTVKPECEEEVHLLKVVQDLDWQLIRVRALDANYYAMTLERELDQFADKAPAAQQAYASAVAFEKNARLFNQLSRQQARLTKQREKAIAEFFEARAARKEQLEAAAAEAAAAEAAQQKQAARTGAATLYQEIVDAVDRELAAMPDHDEDDDLEDDGDGYAVNGFVSHNYPQASPEGSPEGN